MATRCAKAAKSRGKKRQVSCATGGLEPGLKSPQQASDKVASFCTRILQIRDFALRILWSFGTELLRLSRVSKISLRHTSFGLYQVPSALFRRYGMLLRVDWGLASRRCSINDIPGPFILSTYLRTVLRTCLLLLQLVLLHAINCGQCFYFLLDPIFTKIESAVRQPF